MIFLILASFVILIYVRNYFFCFVCVCLSDLFILPVICVRILSGF